MKQFNPQWTQVPEDLKRDLELLEWSRMALSRVTSLPNSKLTDTLKERIDFLLSNGKSISMLENTIHRLEEELSTLSKENSLLREKALDKGHTSYQGTQSRFRSQIPWFLLVILLYIIGSLLYNWLG